MAKQPEFRILANRLNAMVAADGELSQGSKLLFDKITMLADWAQGRTGLCFPGYERLAKLVGRCVRMIGNYLRELRDAGYLSWARRQRCPNVYFLNFELVSAAPPAAEPLPAGFKPAVAGYPFAGGTMFQRGVRELLRGAAAVKACLIADAGQVGPPAAPGRPAGSHGFVVGERVYGMRPGGVR